MSSVKVVRPKNRYSSLSAPGLLRLMGRAGGFPLRFDPADPEGGPEGNGAVAWARPTMVTLLQLTLMFLCWLQVKLEYGGFTRVAEAAEAMGLAEVDIWLPMTLFIFSFFVTAANLAAFAGKGRGVYSVYRGLSRLSTFDEGSLRNRWRLWLFLICCVHLAALASGASYFVVSYRAFEASTPGGRLSVTDYLACGTFAVGFLLGSMGPVSSSVILMSTDVVVWIGDICQDWADKMKEDKDGYMSRFKRHSAFGFKLCRAAEAANKNLGPFLVASYLYFFGGGVLMTYGAVGVAAVPPPPSSNEGKGLANQMLLCSGNALMAIMFYLTVLVVSTCGDRMRTKREQAVAAFKAMTSECYPELDDRSRYDSDRLCSALSASVAIAPGNYFEVSNSNFLSVLAVHATYIIVLLQFRGVHF